MDISITTSLARSYAAMRSGRLVHLVRVGEPLYLVMPLSGHLTAPPSVQWMRNGVDIPGATETPYLVTEEDVGENVLAARGTLPDGTPFQTPNAVSVRAVTKPKPRPDPEPQPELVMVSAPSIAGLLVAGQEGSLDFGTWEGAESLAGTLLRNGEIYLEDLSPRGTVTWATDDAGAFMVLRVEARAGDRTLVAESEPVSIAAPLSAPRRVGNLEDEIFDIESGDQSVETAQVFEGEDLSFSVSGANATIDASTGVVTVPTEAALTGVVVTVTATNAAGSDKASFQVTVEDEEVELPEAGLAPFERIVDNAASGLTASFAASAEGAQDENGRWLLRFAGPDDEIRITGFDTPSVVDANGRVLHGCMIDPWLGLTRARDSRMQGFDSYDGSTQEPYDSALNVDPGNTGQDIVIRAADHPDGATIVKALSREGTGGFPGNDRECLQAYFVIVIVPHDAVVPQDFYCPAPRQYDKRKILSYHDLELSRLGTIDTTPLAKVMNFSMSAGVDSFGLSFPANEGQRMFRAAGNHLPTYGRDLLSALKVPMAGLVSASVSPEQKRDYLRFLVPAGLNAIYTTKDELDHHSHGYFGNGAHMSGRLPVAVLVAALTQDSEHLDTVGAVPIGGSGNDPKGWHEKDQAFVVSDGTLTDYLGFDWPVNDLARPLTGNENDAPKEGVLPFQPGHVGMPYYGEQHAADPTRDDPTFQYRYSYQNYPQMVEPFAALLAVEGAREAMAYEPTWAVLDRYVRIMRGVRDGRWPSEKSVLYSAWSDHVPSIEAFEFWDACTKASGRAPWMGQPEQVYIDSVDSSAANQLSITLDPFIQMNGGAFQRFDVEVIPALPEYSDAPFWWTDWVELKDKALYFEGVSRTVAADGRSVLTVSDDRLGEGQTFKVRVRAVNNLGEGAFYKSSAGTVARGEAVPINWIEPTVSFPGLQGIGEEVTIAAQGAWTGVPGPSMNYRWERSRDQGQTVEAIPGATSSSYVYTAEDVGFQVRPVVIASNNAGSTETACWWCPKEVEADPQPLIDGASFYLQRATDTVMAATEHGFVTAGSSFAVWLTTFGEEDGSSTLTVGNTTVGPAARGKAYDSGDSSSILYLIDVPAEETSNDFVLSRKISGAGAIYRLSGPSEVHDMAVISTSGDKSVTRSVKTVWGGGVLLGSKSRFSRVDLVAGDFSPSLDDTKDELFAYLPETRDGTASATVGYDNNFNRSGLLVSLKRISQ